MGNLDGTEVDILFLVSKTETPGNKTYNPNDNQKYSNNRGSFHR